MDNKEESSKSNELTRRAEKLDHELVELIQRRLAIEASRLTAPERSTTDWIQIQKNELERLLQEDSLSASEATIRAIFNELFCAARESVRPETVAFLGPENSYSYLAATSYFGSTVSLSPVLSIATVFEDVANGAAQFGVVPLENSTDGRISDTMQMFVRLPVKIAAEIRLRVRHTLLAKSDRSKIKRVCSKPQAISQCRAWIAKHLPGVEIVETASTTAAAQLASNDEQTAAIASRQAGIEYDLQVIESDIQDAKNNVTRFAVISDHDAQKSGADLTCLLMGIPHRSGALAEVMTCFQRHQLNLTWIESFPAPNTMSEYLFFIEFVGHRSDSSSQAGIAELESLTTSLEVLGSYAQTNPIEA